MKCEFGCDKEALHQLKNGRWCCSLSINSCEGMRKKNAANKFNKPSGRKGKFGKPSWNKGLTKETDERVKNNVNSLLLAYKNESIIPSFKGKHHNDESRKNISSSMMGNRNANHRGDRQSYYKNIRMDSHWEVLVATYFDNAGISWRYNAERYLLSSGNYIHPDFFIYDELNSLEKIIEVKGYFREQNKRKFEMFIREYPNLKVELWNKEVLKTLKII